MLLFCLSLLETEEDRDRITALYKQHYGLLYHVAYEILHDRQLAEDAVHNGFINLINSLYDLEKNSCHKNRGLLVVITRNAAKDIRRKRDRLPVADAEAPSAVPSVTPDMLDGIATRRLADILAALPAIYRDAMVMRAYYAMNEKQIAAALNVSHATVRKRLERARKMLAEAINEQEEIPYERI